MKKMEGRIALITGGNSSIGLATAKQFVNEGAYVFITGAMRRSWLRRPRRSAEKCKITLAIAGTLYPLIRHWSSASAIEAWRESAG